MVLIQSIIDVCNILKTTVQSVHKSKFHTISDCQLYRFGLKSALIPSDKQAQQMWEWLSQLKSKILAIIRRGWG